MLNRYKNINNCIWQQKKLLCLMFVFIVSTDLLFSQIVQPIRFNSTQNNISIPDFDVSNHHTHPLIVNILVQNQPNKTGKQFGLETVQVAIKHKYISDIKIELYSPKGTMVWISNRNGKDGADYLETKFNQNGFKGHITQGKPPFLGEYIPDGELANFNDGQNPNGVWQLKIYDLKIEDSGSFHGASLFFGKNPALKKFAACSFLTPKGCKCSENKKEGWLLPDLQLIPEFTLNHYSEFPPSNNKNGKIFFGVQTVNLGLGPLEVISENKWFCDSIPVQKSQPCKNGNYSRTQLTQIIYGLKKKKWVTQTYNAGTIAYDARPGHEHYHADEYVTYELLQKTDSNSNVSSWKLVSKGVKASFCIWDLASCREETANCRVENSMIYTPRNIVNYGLGGKYNGCNEALQGLSVGGIDYYGEHYEGQEIELPKGLKNGTYYLRLIVDPNNNYKESNENNNEVIIPIHFTKQEN